jgi:Chromosome segregation ATPases
MLEKYLTANEYYLQKKDVESLHLDRTNNEFAKKEIINKLANVEERIKAALKEIEEGEAQMNSEESIRYKELKAEVRAKKKEISTLESEIRNLERSIKDSEKEMDKRELEIAELESAVTRADHKAVYLDSTIQRQTAIYEEKRDLFHKNARQMDAVRKGDRTVEDELDSRLGAAELNLADVNSEIKKRETQKQHLLQELEKYKKGTQMSQEEHKKVEREIKVLSEKVEIMRRQIEGNHDCKCLKIDRI